MTDPIRPEVRTERAPLFAARERRILLWLVVAAVSWRWLLAMHTPLPGIDACADLWLAQRLAHGEFAALCGHGLSPWWSLSLAPALAAGAPPFLAAQVLACIAGGFTLWPVSVAAERLREGAGVPAAVLALAAGTAATAAGAGAASSLLGGAVAVAMADLVGGRWLRAAVVAGLVVAAGSEVVLPAPPSNGGWSAGWGAVRDAWSLGAAFALLSVLPPRPARIHWLWLAGALAVAAAMVPQLGAGVLLVWSPLAAVLAGVGLARLPVRVRDLALVGGTALGMFTAWQRVEPREAVAERFVGAWLRGRVPPGQRLVTDLPRLAFYAGQEPTPLAAEGLLAAAGGADVAGVVLGGGAAQNPTTTSALASRFMRQQLPASFADLVPAGQFLVFWRRE